MKSGTTYPSAVERDTLRDLPRPANASIECWRFPDRCRAPLIEQLECTRVMRRASQTLAQQNRITDAVSIVAETLGILVSRGESNPQPAD